MRSTATPWAFIETSIAPLDAPSTISASGSSHGSGASSGSGSTSAQMTPAIRVARTLPSRTIAWPMIGSATITPIAIAEDDQAERALGEVEALLDPRDVADPGADDGAVHEEDAEGRQARGVMRAPRSRRPPRSRRSAPRPRR